MASPLPSRWSTSCSSYKPSFPSSSSSVFFQFHIIQTKRHRITTVSLLDSSSSTSSNPKRRLRRSLNSEISNPKLLTTDCNAENEVSVQTVGSQNRGTLSFQTLFGRQSLWGRILFASKRVRSVILLNAITIVYASNIPVLKEVEASMDPAAFTVVRFTVSAIPFIPFVLRARGDVETRNAGIELGFWVGLGYLMQTLGLLSSEAGRASFISMFTVIVVPLLDGMLGAIVPGRTWFGVLMSILGVAMLECSGSPPNVGDLLNFLSAVFFGVHMLRTEHISRRTTKENFLPLLGYEVCVVAFFSTMWYFVGGWSANIQQYDISSWTLAMFWDLMVAFPWIPMLYTGIFSTGLCLWIEDTTVSLRASSTEEDDEA